MYKHWRIMPPLHRQTSVYISCFFATPPHPPQKVFLCFWQTHTHALFWDNCFGFLGMSLLAFNTRVGCTNHIAVANVVYIICDPSLVLHIANLLTVSILGWWPVSHPSQRYYCLTPLRLKLASIRS